MIILSTAALSLVQVMLKLIPLITNPVFSLVPLRTTSLETVSQTRSMVCSLWLLVWDVVECKAKSVSLMPSLQELRVIHGMATEGLGHSNYAKFTDQSITTDGQNIDKSLCNGFDNNGNERGAPGKNLLCVESF